MSTLPPIAQPLEQDEAEAAFGAILDGTIPDENIRDFLIALSDRGETASEIAGAALAMRARMIPITAPANAIDRRLHVVIDAARRHATKHPEPMHMGVK